MNTHASDSAVKLTSLCHGGGCGCKLSPEMLTSLLKNSPIERLIPSALMVGNDNADDAAVYRLNDEQALILTTDFFLPVVDDPSDFGKISATNAISDVYAMGGTPIMALAIVGMPINKISAETIRAILHGGESVCAQAGIPLAGGHSIDSAEPFYGLVVAGLAHPRQIRPNANAQVGDLLVLLKPLGIGIYSAALRQGALAQEDYREMIGVATQLNRIGTWFGNNDQVHALTDVTGFGLPGHLLEICRASGVNAEIHWSALPWLNKAKPLAQAGYITGASKRNWESYGSHIQMETSLSEWERLLLCDPQTSGGLLASVAVQGLEELRSQSHSLGFIAPTIGKIVPNINGQTTIRVRA